MSLFHKINILIFFSFIYFCNLAYSTQDPCDFFDPSTKFELSTTPQKIIYVSTSGTSYRAIITKLDNDVVRTEFLDGDRAGRIEDSKLSTIYKIIDANRIKLHGTNFVASEYQFITPSSQSAGRPYQVDQAVIDIGMIFDQTLLVRNKKVAYPIENKFTEAKVIGRGENNNKLVLVEVTNIKGEVSKHEVEVSKLRELEVVRPVALKPVVAKLTDEQIHFSETITPGKKVEAHIYRGGNIGARDVILNNRVYYYKDEIVVPRSDKTFTRGRVIGAKAETNELIIEYFNKEGHGYSKEISVDQLKYAEDFVKKPTAEIKLLEPYVFNTKRNDEMMKANKDHFEFLSGYNTEQWKKTKFHNQGTGKIGESFDIKQLRELDSKRGKSAGQGFIWAIDAQGELKILPKQLVEKFTWPFQAGDDVAKHFNLLDGKGAQAAGELHFDAQSGKAIFDFGSGTYMRQAAPEQQAAMYDKIAPKLKELTGEEGFTFRAQ
jgi:hypothetical protein